MDTFVKGENEMWKMPAKERIQTRIVSASAVKRVLDLLSVYLLPPPPWFRMPFGTGPSAETVLTAEHKIQGAWLDLPWMWFQPCPLDLCSAVSDSAQAIKLTSSEKECHSRAEVNVSLLKASFKKKFSK